MNPMIGGGDSNITPLTLPKEFTKSFFSNFDRFFWNIFFITLVGHVSLMIYLIQHPTLNKVTPRDIERIQRQYASFILDSSNDVESLSEQDELNRNFESGIPSKKDSPAKQDSRSSKTRTASGSSKQPQGQDYAHGGSSGSANSRFSGSGTGRAGDDIGNMGLLGLLTAGTASENSDQRAATDVLSSNIMPDSDLDQVLARSDALSATGRSEGKGTHSKKDTPAQADRITRGGNIDNLLTELGKATTTELERSDNLIHSELSPVTVTDDQGHEVNISGARDPQGVFGVVNRHVDGIEYCFKREVRRKPDLRGKVVVRFTIVPAGTVKDVRIVSSTLNSANVERCIITRIEHWDDFGVIDPKLGDATFRQVYTFGY